MVCLDSRRAPLLLSGPSRLFRFRRAAVARHAGLRIPTLGFW